MRAQLVALTTLALVVSVIPHSAASATGWGATWLMDETSGAMLDASGNGNSSSAVPDGVRRNGSSYVFLGGRPATAVVSVPDHPSLNPWKKDFTLAVDVDFYGGGDRNVLQKGQNTAGTFYKLEVVGNDISCYFKNGSLKQSVRAADRKDVIDRVGFTLVQCRKTSSTIALKIGSEPWITRAVAMGTIGNEQPLSIGGKLNVSGDPDFHYDLFAGAIGHVELTTP